MTSKPLISVILPTYNRVDFLQETIESILNQTLSDFELIIINDGSTDRTEEWVKEQTDHRIQYISYEKNQGVSYARNIGLDAAQGKFIAFTDSDDINDARRFAEQVAVLESDDQIVICGSEIKYFGLKSSEIEYREEPLPFRMKAIFQTPFHFPAAMVRQSFLEKENILFRPEVKSADDYYFLMKIVAKGKAFVIQKSLYNYRWHEESISIGKRKEQDFNALKISQMAFEEILNLKLSDAETKLVNRFYRKKCSIEEKDSVDKVISKITSHLKLQSDLTQNEKMDLTFFLTTRKLRFERKWIQLSLFYINLNFRKIFKTEISM